MIMETASKSTTKLNKLYTAECLQHQLLALPVPFQSDREIFEGLIALDGAKFETTYGLYSSTAGTQHQSYNMPMDSTYVS